MVSNKHSYLWDDVLILGDARDDTFIGDPSTEIGELPKHVC